MKPEIKKLWVDALRSGKFKQGLGRLRPGNSMRCCLGVLCEIHMQSVGGQWVDGAYLGELSILPDAVVAWAGLADFNPDVEWTGQPLRKGKTLASINDSGKADFNTIADLIEASL